MTRRSLARRLALSIGLRLARWSGAAVEIERVTPAAATPSLAKVPAGHVTAGPRPDVTQIVNLMAADQKIGLVLQINQPGEPLRAMRFDGPGGRA